MRGILLPSLVAVVSYLYTKLQLRGRGAIEVGYLFPNPIFPPLTNLNQSHSNVWLTGHLSF